MDFKKLCYYVYDKGNVVVGKPLSVSANYSKDSKTCHLIVSCEFTTKSDNILHVKDFEADCENDRLPERILVLSSDYDQFMGLGINDKQSEPFLRMIATKLDTITTKIEATQATIATALENN